MPIYVNLLRVNCTGLAAVPQEAKLAWGGGERRMEWSKEDS